MSDDSIVMDDSGYQDPIADTIDLKNAISGSQSLATAPTLRITPKGGCALSSRTLDQELLLELPTTILQGSRHIRSLVPRWDICRSGRHCFPFL